MRKCIIENCNRKYVAHGYCKRHWQKLHRRIDTGSPLDLSIDLRYLYKGGHLEYPNTRFLRKQRLLKIQQTNGKCEVCGNKGKYAHHKDLKKDNHSLANLIFLCTTCHTEIHYGKEKGRKGNY